MNATLTQGTKVREIDANGSTLGYRVVISTQGKQATCALFKPLANGKVITRVIPIGSLVETGDTVRLPKAASKTEAKVEAAPKAQRATKGVQPEGLRRYQAARKAAKAGVSPTTASPSTDSGLATKVSLVVEALESAIAVLRTI